MSGTSAGECTFADRASAGPARRSTRSVASAYSPVPGISDTPRTSALGAGGSPGASTARTTSKSNDGTRLPQGARSRPSITT